MSKALFTLTEAAADQVKLLLSRRDTPALGIRIGVRQRGCSGNAYTLEFIDTPHEFDEVVTSHGVTLYIDPKAVLFVIGTEMDFVDEKIQSGFTFRNPNVKGECGCKESFYV